jgi:hypothetical protein
MGQASDVASSTLIGRARPSSCQSRGYAPLLSSRLFRAWDVDMDWDFRTEFPFREPWSGGAHLQAPDTFIKFLCIEFFAEVSTNLIIGNINSAALRKSNTIFYSSFSHSDGCHVLLFVRRDTIFFSHALYHPLCHSNAPVCILFFCSPDVPYIIVLGLCYRESLVNAVLRFTTIF